MCLSRKLYLNGVVVHTHTVLPVSVPVDPWLLGRDPEGCILGTLVVSYTARYTTLLTRAYSENDPLPDDVTNEARGQRS